MVPESMIGRWIDTYTCLQLKPAAYISSLICNVSFIKYIWQKYPEWEWRSNFGNTQTFTDKIIKSMYVVINVLRGTTVPVVKIL